MMTPRQSPITRRRAPGAAAWEAAWEAAWAGAWDPATTATQAQGPSAARAPIRTRIREWSTSPSGAGPQVLTVDRNGYNVTSAAQEPSPSLTQSIDRARLILTQQYTPNPSPPATAYPAVQNPGLQWSNGSPAAPGATARAAPAQPAPTQLVPVQPAPPYGQDMWPTQGPQRPVDSPQGPYVPGPIFGENSPFRDGPPDGGSSGGSTFTVTANEAMTGRLMFGVGVNSDAGLVGQITLDEQNFDWTRFPTSWEDIRNGTAWRGAGERFRLEAMPGTQLQRYMVTFQEPYLFDTPVSLGAERILLRPHLHRIYRSAAWRPGGLGIPVRSRPVRRGGLPRREDQHHQSDRPVAARPGRSDPTATWPCTSSKLTLTHRQTRQRLPGHRRTFDPGVVRARCSARSSIRTRKSICGSTSRSTSGPTARDATC